MSDRAVVEPVAGELETVVAELEDQVPLEHPCRLVGDAATAESGMHGEPADVGDSVRLTQLVERHHPGALAVDLDDHPAGLLRLAQRTLDLGSDRRRVARVTPAEERLGLLVGVELNKPIHVVGSRAAQHDHDVCGAPT